MGDKLKRWAPACLILVAMLAVACGGGEEDLAASRAEEFTALQNQYQTLKDKRVELAEAVAALAAAPEEDEAASDETEGEGGEGEAGEGEAGGAEVVSPEQMVSQLESEVQSMTEEFIATLVAFINADPPIMGEPMNDEQRAAMSMKADEDIVVAMEFIDKGGDHRRAIQIIEDSLVNDPDNAALKAALAEAEALRYMTPERFEAVKKGMSEGEVRELLGQVNLRNIREYEDKGVISWFYTKEEGGAAGVFFRKKGEDWRVYEIDFNAVEAPKEE